MALKDFLGAGASVGSSVISNLFNIGQAKKERNFQKEMASSNYQHDIDMWNKANEYNAPQAQMQRLKEAGLNPNLAYGSGSVAGNTSTQTPKHQSYGTPTGKLSTMPNMLAILGQFADLKGKQLSNESQSITNSFLHDRLMFANLSGKQNYKKGLMDLGDADQMFPLNKQSPYFRKTQGSAQAAELNNRLKQINLDFLKSIPKEFQWMTPILMQLIGKM